MRNNQLIEERKFYNYIYCDPRKPTPYKIKGVDIILPAEPFYVGRGKGDRFLKHLTPSQLKNLDSGNKYKKEIISEIKKSKLTPIILIISSGLSFQESDTQERYLIRAIGRQDLGLGLLTNLTNGGNGGSGLNVKQEIRDKMSKKRKGNKNPNFGKKTSKEKLLKIINSQPKRDGVFQIDKETHKVAKYWLSRVSLIKEKKIYFKKNVFIRDRDGFFWVRESEWVKNKLSNFKEKVNPNQGKKTPEERRKRILRSQPTRKQVFQTTLDYSLVKIWPSQKFLKREMGLDMSKRKGNIVEKDGYLYIKEIEWNNLQSKKC